MQETHTGKITFDLTYAILSAVIASNWNERLLGITTDGAANLTCEYSGAVSQLQDTCSYPVLRVFRGCYQLYLVMQYVSSQQHKDSSFYQITSILFHLSCQTNLQVSVSTTCPKSLFNTDCPLNQFGGGLSTILSQFQSTWSKRALLVDQKGLEDFSVYCIPRIGANEYLYQLVTWK